MKLKKPHLLAVATLLLLVFYFVVLKNSSPKYPIPTPSPTISAKGISYSCQPEKTAFELLEEGHEIKYATSDFGKLVTEINGVSQGDGKYWLYSIDGEDATVGADSYTCQGTETIQWQLK